MGSAARIPLVLLAVLCPLAPAGCDGDDEPGPGVDAGAGQDAGDTPCTEADGAPELTGPPTVPASVTTSEDLVATIPVDGDTAYVRLAIEDFATSVTLVNNWADGATGPTTVNATVSIPDTTAPGVYYLTFDLCSTDACTNPFQRSTYERVDDGTTYTRTGFTSPPLTRTDGPCDSGLVIPTVEIQ